MTLEEMKQALLNALAWLQAQQAKQTQPTPPVTPQNAPQEASSTNLEWNTVPRIKASIRAICIEMGMNAEQTSTMIATIGGESGFALDAVCLNLSKPLVEETIVFEDGVRVRFTLRKRSYTTTYSKYAAVKKELAAHGIYVMSADFGLCQWNTYYHGDEITPKESVSDPEKAVRLMAKYWKLGKRDWWIAYKNGSYKKHL